VNALEVLAELDRLGVWLSLERSPSGSVVAVEDPGGRIDDTLHEAMVENRAWIHNAVLGRDTGHALCACTICGQLATVSYKRRHGGKGVPCYMTWRCKGRLIPPLRPRKTKAADNRHPCQYSPEVLEILAKLIRAGDHVHDPFAGTGLRLGQLCDQLGATYSGTDIDDWPGHDRRVVVADALNPASYPTGSFLLVTSPVYQNKRCADYADGPTPTTKTKGRRDYGIALGRALHQDNLARHTGRAARAPEYWRLHAEAVKHWPDRVLLNVDQPIGDRWQHVLVEAGYAITDVIPAYTRRYGGLDNADKRADHEVVIVAHR
jgi:hypothetical protein